MHPESKAEFYTDGNLKPCCCVCGKRCYREERLYDKNKTAYQTVIAHAGCKPLSKMKILMRQGFIMGKIVRLSNNDIDFSNI